MDQTHRDAPVLSVDVAGRGSGAGVTGGRPGGNVEGSLAEGLVQHDGPLLTRPGARRVDDQRGWSRRDEQARGIPDAALGALRCPGRPGLFAFPEAKQTDYVKD